MKRKPLLRSVAPCLVASLLVSTQSRGQSASAPASSLPSPGPGDCMSERWLEELWPPLENVTFQPTTLEERAAFTRLIPALLKAAARQPRPPPELEALAKSIGFRLETRTLGTQRETVWALLEQPGKYRGAGAYLFRTGPATDDVIQAPHAYFDKGTERLGAALFACAPEGRRPRAFVTNTAHRHRGHPDEKREDAEHPADVAHNPDHLFQLVTDLLARHLPSLRIIQLHGFDEKKSAAREGVLAVVSSCSAKPSPWARKVADRLVTQLGGGVRLYPEQTQLLGGTRNAQARLLQAYPRAWFLHLEMSAEMRRSLASPEPLVRLGSALFTPLED